MAEGEWEALSDYPLCKADTIRFRTRFASTIALINRLDSRRASFREGKVRKPCRESLLGESLAVPVERIGRIERFVSQREVVPHRSTSRRHAKQLLRKTLLDCQQGNLEHGASCKFFNDYV
jgi:hypothetical protein